MNALGRETLRAAALAGVTQIFHRMRDADGGRCGLAVLHDAAGRDDIIGCYDLCGVVKCSFCERWHTEYTLVAHMQDDHGADFLKLAELMPVTDIGGQG